MDKNLVIKIMRKKIGSDETSFVCGDVLAPGTNDCSTSDDCGSVYGFAIKINSLKHKKEVFDAAQKAQDIQDDLTLQKWHTIGDHFYPLYWGKDKYMGSRITAHTKEYKGTRSIQLNAKTYLAGETIIFGVIQCSNCEKHESEIRNAYKDILKNKEL